MICVRPPRPPRLPWPPRPPRPPWPPRPPRPPRPSRPLLECRPPQPQMSQARRSGRRTRPPAWGSPLRGTHLGLALPAGLAEALWPSVDWDSSPRRGPATATQACPTWMASNTWPSGRTRRRLSPLPPPSSYPLASTGSALGGPVAQMRAPACMCGALRTMLSFAVRRTGRTPTGFSCSAVPASRATSGRWYESTSETRKAACGGRFSWTTSASRMPMAQTSAGRCTSSRRYSMLRRSASLPRWTTLGRAGRKTPPSSSMPPGAERLRLQPPVTRSARWPSIATLRGSPPSALLFSRAYSWLVARGRGDGQALTT
mmetsp:Transcript_16227/g.35984  ORF Transcript_16227/g.35984 Transcript_16227/m.35984 type:complete len:315 (+) Transcript_16227:260-1204(+)